MCTQTSCINYVTTAYARNGRNLMGLCGAQNPLAVGRIFVSHLTEVLPKVLAWLAGAAWRQNNTIGRGPFTTVLRWPSQP